MGPLDFSQTEEGLQLALAALAKARAEGDRNLEGTILLRLSYLVKWVRSDNGQPPFFRAESLALEALEAFRSTGNEHGQVRALVNAISPFNPAVLAQRLDEADTIARRLEDRQLIADVLAAKARGAGLGDKEGAKELALQALEIYRELRKTGSMAACLFTLSVGLGSSEEKRGYALEAARCYRESGAHGHAWKSLVIASMNCDSDKDLIALEPLFLEALAEAQQTGDRGGEKTCYAKMALICEKKGDTQEALRYRRWEADLEQADGLTERERWDNNVEMTKMLANYARANGDKESAKEFAAKLQKLKKNKPRE